MRFTALVEVSAALAATRSRGEKAARLAELLRRAAPAERPPIVAWLTGTLLQGKIGVGWATVRELLDERAAPAAADAELTVAEVDAAFTAIAACSGGGSVARRKALLGALTARATPAERELLARVLSGELRQGGLDGVMAEAIALAAGVPADDVRRAQMLAGALPAVADAALAEGAAGLARFALTLFRPVLPMLASPCDGPDDALARLGRAAFEHKLDGARVQVHREGGDVRVFTRGLLDVTAQVPEVVEAALALPARRLVLDGEAIAFGAGGKPLPFQETMARFAGKRGVAALRARTPLTPVFFDLLLLEDDVLVDRPAEARFAALDGLVPAAARPLRLVTDDAAAARAFLDAAIAEHGHEGAMAKALDAPYQVGGRGQSWLKLKRAHTLDLVVLAVEQGSGRRSCWLSNLHLGARDPKTGGFVMLGKTFKGMTDELLEWQTRELGARATAREGHVVHVRPELVVEVAFDGVQTSSQYPGGVALRFARVKRYRPDKRAEDADTIDAVRAKLGHGADE